MIWFPILRFLFALACGCLTRAIAPEIGSFCKDSIVSLASDSIVREETPQPNSMFTSYLQGENENDDYCDCNDSGSDENRTSACSFYG
jgi:hypothetical protein